VVQSGLPTWIPHPNAWAKSTPHPASHCAPARGGAAGSCKPQITSEALLHPATQEWELSIIANESLAQLAPLGLDERLSITASGVAVLRTWLVGGVAEGVLVAVLAERLCNLLLNRGQEQVVAVFGNSLER
jgi:hypothetical protein